MIIYERYRNYYYPRIIIYSLDFQTFTDLENSGDTAGYIHEIMQGIEGLQQAGADFVLMAANSPHAVFDQIKALAQVPLLSLEIIVPSRAEQDEIDRIIFAELTISVFSAESKARLLQIIHGRC